MQTSIENPEKSNNITKNDKSINTQPDLIQKMDDINTNIEEYKFLSLMKRIINQQDRPDRTGIGTKSIFAPQNLCFSLKNNRFPLLTTRSIPLRHITEELLWFLRGQTDVSILQQKGVHVWDANTTREFLDGRKLYNSQIGDAGPSYGFQMRHNGAEYIDCKTDYTGLGFDQLSSVIHLLKNDPFSRRILINLWNPKDTDKMPLPPCGFCYQFYVTEGKDKNWLCCKLIQRSSDISLAGGWNIASASLLTIMLAHICNLKPKELIWSIGDAHIYLNQMEGVVKQLARKPRQFPKLYIVKDPIDMDITKFEADHFRLEGYQPYARIKLPMNA